MTRRGSIQMNSRRVPLLIAFPVPNLHKSSTRYVVKSGRKRQQETDSCINSREDTVVSFRAY